MNNIKKGISDDKKATEAHQRHLDRKSESSSRPVVIKKVDTKSNNEK